MIASIAVGSRNLLLSFLVTIQLRNKLTWCIANETLDIGTFYNQDIPESQRSNALASCISSEHAW